MLQPFNSTATMYPGFYDPDKPAYIMASSNKCVTYGDLETASNQIAHLFRTLGLTRGDTIALCLENHPWFFKICWGAYRSGIYFTAISYRLQPEEVEYILNDCGAKVLITSAELSSTFDLLKNKLRSNPTCYMLDGIADGATPFESMVAEQPKQPIEDESYGERLLYSSGTTGMPKGVKKPLPANPWGKAEPHYLSRRDRYGFDQQTIYLSPAPLYHAAPLGFTMNVQRFGGCCIIMEQYESEDALALIEKHQVTHSQWVPTMFVRLLKLPEDMRAKYDLASHQVAIHAAAPCPVAVKEQIINWWGPILHEYYAGTEGNGSTWITSEEWLQHRGSVGRAAGGVKLHILDDNFDEVAVGETGGVYFEGGGTFEYLGDKDKTADSRSPQGFSTLGDIGYLDAEGYLYLTDRKSFMIISGGVNIYPQEAENALITHSAVMDVAVFGVPSTDFGEEVKAVVQPVDMADAGSALEAELIAYAREKISHIKCPRSIEFLAELPRHPTGKLYKRLLKDKYWHDQ